MRGCPKHVNTSGKLTRLSSNVLKLRKEEVEKAAALAAAAQTAALADTRPTSVQSSIRNTFLPVRPQASVKAIPATGKDTTTDPHVRVNGHRTDTSSDRKSKVCLFQYSVLQLLDQFMWNLSFS